MTGGASAAERTFLLHTAAVPAGGFLDFLRRLE